jgi:hypothetical protein
MSTTQERRLARAKKWLRDRWNNGGFSFADTAAMLVEYEEYLSKCEAERQSE